MTLEIRPLSDALGAEVLGGDFTKPLENVEIGELNGAFLQHHLLCLRGDRLSPAEFYRVASYFGTPFTETTRKNWVGDVPEISRLESTYKTEEARPNDPKLNRRSGWHTDHSFKEVPPKATLLHGHEIPSSAGHTRFCNTRKAYEDLATPMKNQLEGLMAVHSYDTKRAPARPIERTAEEISETPDVAHPLVRRHDETGDKVLYFNSNRTDHIVGMERAESNQLLDSIHEHMTQPKYRYDHDWLVGDIIVWDNRCLIHSVNVEYPVGEPRIHLRTLIKGVRPN